MLKQFHIFNPDAATIDAVVPCYNEAPTLEANVQRLRTYLAAALPGRFTITIVDNASTDATAKIGERLASRFPEVQFLREPGKGRGRALKTAWGRSRADVLIYMDEDLSTDLSHIPELVAALSDDRTALAVGTRLAPGSQTRRGFKREVISRGYVWLLRAALGLRVSDAQCGFKAIRREAAAELLSEVTDNQWFFDTELIVRCQDRGWRVAEVPVKWDEDPDSRVNLIRTMAEDVHGIDRLRREAGKRTLLDTAVMGGLMLAATFLYPANITLNQYAVSLPQALLGAGIVGFIYGSVRRAFGRPEAIIAALVMIGLPAAAPIFQFHNSDALLTFLLTASAYALIRALSSPMAVWWFVLIGVLTGYTLWMASPIGWFWVPALASAGLVLWLTRRFPRTDPRRATVLLWGSWLGLYGAVHPSYAATMAPAVAALAGIGAPLLWQACHRRLTAHPGATPRERSQTHGPDQGHRRDRKI